MADQNIIKESFPVIGMSCASCAARVDKTLNRQAGVKQAAVNYASAMALVEYDCQLTNPETLQRAVQEAGYDLYIAHEEAVDEVEQAQQRHYRSLKQRAIWALAVSVVIMLIGMLFSHYTLTPYVMWLLATPVVFWAVSAVMTLMPYTLWAAIVLRSAWIPAPPELSEPAIVSAL